jgi:hypothetical protein
MRKLLFGLFGLMALGFGAFTAQPAEAQPYYGYRPHYRPVVEFHAGPVMVRRVDYHRPRRAYRPYQAYRPYPAYRPVRTVRRCWVEPRRVWNGYRWTRRPVEVCRTVRRPSYRY